MGWEAGETKASKARRTECELASGGAYPRTELLNPPDAFDSPVASSTLPRGRLVRQLAVPNHGTRSDEEDDDRGSQLRSHRIPTSANQNGRPEPSSPSAADSGRPLERVGHVAGTAAVVKRSTRTQSNWSTSEVNRLRYLSDVCALERLDSCKDWRKLRSAFPGPKAVLTRFGRDSVPSVAVPSRSTRAVYTKGKSVEWTSTQMQRLQDCLAGIELAEVEQIIRCVRQHPHATVFTGDVRKSGALSLPEERVQRAFASFDQVAMTKRARGLVGRSASECLRRMRIIAESHSDLLRSDLQSGGENANDFVVTKATAAGDVSSVAGVFRVWLRRLGSRRQAPERQPTLCKRAEIGVFSGQKTCRRQLNGC